MRVSVFGGSQPKEDDAAYNEARELGRFLAERGHVVLTGGYIGTMEAVSRGAYEAGGHVIGVTCAEIERWRPVGANSWVKEEWKKETLFERLQVLIQNCDCGARPSRRARYTDRNRPHVESVDHWCSPPETVNPDWRRLAERLQSGFHSIGSVHSRAST